METDEINRIMLADPICREFYGGALALDELVEIKAMTQYIVNLDPSHMKGSHWTYLGSTLPPDHRGRVTLEFFDSFGRPPPPPLLSKLLEYAHEVIYCDIPLQHVITQTCGGWSVVVAKLRARNYSLLDIVTKLFKGGEGEYLRNDATIYSTLRHLATLRDESFINWDFLLKK